MNARLFVLTFTQRDAIEAGLIAAGSGFTLTTTRHRRVVQMWRLQYRAATIFVARCIRLGSTAVFLLGIFIAHSAGKHALVRVHVSLGLRIVVATVMIFLYRGA